MEPKARLIAPKRTTGRDRVRRSVRRDVSAGETLGHDAPPTTAASSSAVPMTWAAARRARFNSAAGRRCGRYRCGHPATSRCIIVALFGVGDDEVRLPAPAIGIRCPHFILDGIAARLVHLDINGVASRAKTPARVETIVRAGCK